MRVTPVLAAGLIAAAGLAAHAGEAEPAADRATLLRQGIELHDAGSFKAAIETYQKILDSNPRDAAALYEIGNSYLSLGDFRNCETFARRSIDIQPTAYAYSLAASCQEENGDVPGALATFAKSIELYPGDVMLNFNYAVTLARQNRGTEAKQHLRTAIKAEPHYSSPYLTYAGVLSGEQNEVAALYMWLRFLMLEPGSQRSREVAHYVTETLTAPPDENSNDKQITIHIPPKQAPSDEFPTDPMYYAVIQQLLAAAGAKAGPKNDNDTPADRLVSHAVLMLGMMEEKSNTDDGRDRQTFVWQNAVVPLMSLKDGDLRTPFLYYVAALAKLDGAGAWLDAHPKEFDALKQRLSKRD